MVAILGGYWVVLLKWTNQIPPQHILI
jgi:hypothetical protein